MTTFTVTTFRTSPRIPGVALVSGEPACAAEPFEVVVDDGGEIPVAAFGAMSGDHARMIAGALVMLLPKLDPRRCVVLDASIHGSGWRTPNAAS